MPWWSGSSTPKTEQTSNTIPNSSSSPDSSNSEPKKITDPRKFSKELHPVTTKAETESHILDDLREGYAPPSTDSNLRYAAYATRLKTILVSAHRYVAYTSDIGESFRPVAHPNLVRFGYGVSWLYILGDVSYEGYKSYWQNQRVLNPQLKLSARQEQLTGLPADGVAGAAPGVVAPIDDWRTVTVQRGIFQSVASMGLPAFTIHSVVRYSGRAMKDVKNTKIRTWGPIGLGLAVVPFLPAVFDKPVEHTVEWMFHKGFETFGGSQFVGDAPMTGRERLLSERPKKKEE